MYQSICTLLNSEYIDYRTVLACKKNPKSLFYLQIVEDPVCPFCSVYYKADPIFSGEDTVE